MLKEKEESEVDFSMGQDDQKLEIYATVTPSCKAVPQEPRQAIFAKWSGAWLPRGSYGVFTAITGSTCMWMFPNAHGNLPVNAT